MALLGPVHRPWPVVQVKASAGDVQRKDDPEKARLWRP